MPDQSPYQSPPWRKLLARRRFYIGLQLLLVAVLLFWGIRLIDCYLETHNVQEALKCTVTFNGLFSAAEESSQEATSEEETLTDDTSNLRVPIDSLEQAFTPTVPLPQAEIIPEPIDDLKAAWYQSYGLIVKIVIMVLIATFLVFYEIYHQNRKKLFADQEDELAPPYFWKVKTLPGTNFSLYKEDDFFEASQLVLRQFAAEGLVKDSAQGIIPVVVLIERQAPQDHLAMLLDQVILDLSSQNIHVHRFFFEQDPRLVWSEKYTQELLLDELKSKHPDHRLVIVGATEIFFDPVTDAFSDWMKLLDSWEDVVFMTTEYPISWGNREIRLSQRLIVTPATFEALGTLPSLFQGEVPSLKHWLMHNRYPELPQEYCDDLIKALHLYFDTEMEGLAERYRQDHGKSLFTWLCMCAVYPELSWDLTLALGYTLGSNRNEQIVTPTNVFRLASLNWFREGSMPHEVRETLLPHLSKSDLKLTRQTILNMLQNNPPPEDSFAAEEHELRLAVFDAQVNPGVGKDIKLIQKVQDFSLNHELRDPVVIKYLQTLPHVLPSFSSLRSIYRTAFEQGVPILGFQSWLRLSVGVLAIVLIALTLEPSRLDHVYTAGEDRYLLKDQRDEMRFYTHMGEVSFKQNEYEQAEAYFNQAIDIQQSIGDETYLTPRYNLAYLQMERGDLAPAQEGFATISEEADELLAENVPDRSLETTEHLQSVKGASEYVQAVNAYRSMELEAAEDKARESVKAITRLDPRAMDVRYVEGVIWFEQGIRGDSGSQNYLNLAGERFEEIRETDPTYFERNRALYPIIDSIKQTKPALKPSLDQIERILEGKARIQPTTPQAETALAPGYEQLSAFQDGWSLVKAENGSYAYRDPSGRIQGTFLDARPFYEGLAAVKIGALWGFVDTDLQVVIDAQYTAARDFHAGVATAKQDGKWGLIDSTGELVIPFAYQRPILFEDERETPPDKTPLAVVVKDGAYQYLDRKGQLAFEGTKFEYAANFRGNVARVKRWKTKYYIDHNGQCIPASLPDKQCPYEQWRARTLGEVSTHRGDIDVVAVAPDGRYFITGGADSTVQIHSPNGLERYTLLKHSARVRSLAIHPDSRQFATGTDAQQLTIWEVGGAIFRRHQIQGGVRALAYSPDGQYLIAGTEGGRVYLLSTKDGAILQSLRTENDVVRMLCFHPNSQTFVVGGAEGILRIYALDGTLTQKIAYPGVVFAMAYRPSGDLLAVAGRKGIISLFNIQQATPTLESTWTGHRDWISQLDYSADGQYLLSSSYDRSIKVWNAQGGVVLTIPQAFTIRGAVFSADQARIYTAGWGTTGNQRAMVYEVRRF